MRDRGDTGIAAFHSAPSLAHEKMLTLFHFVRFAAPSFASQKYGFSALGFTRFLWHTAGGSQKSGGDTGTRTLDPLLAKQVL